MAVGVIHNLIPHKVMCTFWMVLFATHVHVNGYRTHWWKPDNHNYNHNQIGQYQDGGDSYHPPPDHGHAYVHDSRIPKDIMVDVINNMGLALLEAHNEHNENNIAISPYGATSVLIAILEGLAGEAAYEIKIATQLPPDLSVVRIGLRDIHRHLKSYFIPKEGFLAGLTLSHDNITLNREYQSILKFYGYDIDSFNNPVYPDIYDSTTSRRPAVTMTTGKMKPTTTMPPSDMTTTTELPETTTLESISTIIDKLTSTLPMDGDVTESTTTGTTTTESVTSTKRPKTTRKKRPRTTTEMPSTTLLPSPNDEDVEGTTTKKLPTRSYTTEAIDVTDPEGRTETFYSMTTTLKSAESEDRSEIPTETDVVTDTTLTSITKEEFKSTSASYESESDDEPGFRTEEEFDFSTIRIPTSPDGVTAISSFKTTKGTFFEATTYLPSRTSTSGTTTGVPSITEVFRPSTPLTTTENSDITLAYEIPEGSTLKYESTTFEGTTFFAMETTSAETITATTDKPRTPTTITPGVVGTTQTEEFVTFTERDNEIFSELNQKLTKTETSSTITTTNTPVSEITFTTTEPMTAYTQTQNTEATSLEDKILGERTFPGKPQNTSSFKIAAKIITTEKQTRKKRSVIDYLIARYYDDYYINNNRRYLPMSTPKTHYFNYQPEEPYTFLVNGKHKETNISFMTYDTILPFYYIRSLDAMALSFPLDSNMYYLLLVLPLDPHGIDKLVYEMRKATSLRNIVEKLQYTHVKAVIPSFMLKGYVVLTPTLQKLCIRKIFEPRHANFSPMTPERNLYVTNIEQAVTVTIRNYVDPASHSARNLDHYRPTEFRADHPFLYFVMDSQIHVNLMAGKIINPLNSRIR
ncbi:uncharacterized protein [Atheta coriaria]|uniref:uncharacterized protein n=1 Tax=Dalotia coriaria TaxID=877792 RepID=UPI0031F43D20